MFEDTLGSFGNMMAGAGQLGFFIRDLLSKLMILAPFFIIFFGVYYIMSFKHKIKLRKPTKGQTDLNVDDRWKIIKKQGEPTHIKTLKTRLKLPIPPKEALDLQENGKFDCEGYLTGNREIKYINVKGEIDKEYEKKLTKAIETWKKEGHSKDIIEDHIKYNKFDKIRIGEISASVITTEDEDFYWSNMKEAKEQYQKNNIWTFLHQNAGLIGLIIIITLIFVFWQDIMAPTVQIANVNAQVSAQNAKIIEQLDLLINNRQILPIENLKLNSSGIG